MIFKFYENRRSEDEFMEGRRKELLLVLYLVLDPLYNYEEKIINVTFQESFRAYFWWGEVWRMVCIKEWKEKIKVQF